MIGIFDLPILVPSWPGILDQMRPDWVGGGINLEYLYFVQPENFADEKPSVISLNLSCVYA